MVSKTELKYIQSLCHKKQRRQDNNFIAEGAKIIDEIIKSKYKITKIYATQEWIEKFNTNYLSVTEVTPTEMERMSCLQNPGNVLAIVEKNNNDDLLPNNQLNLVLDGIQDPGNLGTIIRIADWFGVENIFCSNDTVGLYNQKVIQSSMGSFVRVNMWYGNIETILKDSKIPVYGAVLNGKSMYELSSLSACFLVIGNEGNGIRNHILPYIKHPITIPKKGGAESLNAAIATGILLSRLVG